ncbi:hypothetical protein V1517DRAFT_321904 [Lipomyces orientalis]|uniref:Uncharacterized protein n=1 Tax=Lipomyces orientalis TaxID=1233043 RepID=A0ACC3TNY6_9ASCO
MSRLRVGETAEDSLEIVKMQEEYKGKISQGSEHDNDSEDESEEDIDSNDDRVSHNSHVSESIRDRLLKDSIPKSGPYIQSLRYSETQKDSSDSPEEEMNTKPGMDQSDHAVHKGSTIGTDPQVSRASSGTPSGKSDDSNINNAGNVDVPKDPTKVSQSSPLFPSSTEIKRYETPNYKITLSQIFNEPSPDSPTPLEFPPPQQTPNKQRYVPLADSQERRMRLRNDAAGQQDPFEKEFVPGPVNLTKAGDAGLSKVFGRGATRLVNVQKLPPHFGRQDARAAGLREPDQITLQLPSPPLPLVPPEQQRAGRVLTHVSASEDDSSGRPSGGEVLDPAVTHDEIDHASDSSDVGDPPNDDSELDNTIPVGHADLTNSRHLRSPEVQVPRTQDENNEGEPNSDTLDETQHITDPGSQFNPFTNRRASPSQRLPPSSPQKMQENQTAMARPSSSPAILSPRSLHSRRQFVSTDTPVAVAPTDTGHGEHSEIIDLSSSAAKPSLRPAPVDQQQSPTRSRIAPPLETGRAKKKRQILNNRNVKGTTNSKQDERDIVIPESIEESPQLTKGDTVGNQFEPPQPPKQQQPQPPPTLISKMPKQKSRNRDQSKRTVDIFEFLETDERQPDIPAPSTTRKSGHSDIEVEVTTTAQKKGQAVVKKRKRAEAPTSAAGDDDGNRRGERKRRRTRETSSDKRVENIVEGTVEEDIPETVAIPDTVQIAEEFVVTTAGPAEPAAKGADITQREDHEEVDELAEPAVKTHRSITSSSSLSSVDDEDSRVSSLFDSEDDYVEGSDKMKPPADQSTRQERQRTTSRANVTTPDPRRPNFDATNVIYPDRAFGLWTGTRQGYYPCRILPHQSAMLLADRSKSRKVDVEFDDGSTAKLDPQHIRSLDLKLGDQIKIDKVGQRSNWYEIVGLMAKPVDDVKSFKPCIRGNNVLRVRMKGAPTSAKTPTAATGAQEEQELEIEVEKIYVPNVKWHQFTQRAVPELVAACVPSLAKYALQPTLADYGVEVASARNERMRSVSSDVSQLEDELPRTRTPIVQYGMSPGGGVSSTPIQHWNTQQSGIVKSNVKHGIFSGSAFALSGYSDKTRVELQNIIISNGGWYFENGIIDLFVTHSDPVGGGVKVLPRKTELQGLRFAAVVSEVCSRRLKYLNAIALGWPCITSSFLIRSSEVGRVLPWWEHRVVHTGELRSLIQSDTSLFVLGFGKGWDLWSMYTRRFKLLYGLNVIILRSAKGQAKAKSNEGSSATLISMMGPNMIAFANDTRALTALLSQADLPFRQPNIPDVTYTTLAAAEESYEDVMYANSRPKLRWDYVYVEGEKSMRTSVEGQVGQHARVLDKTGLITCMSVGRIV